MDTTDIYIRMCRQAKELQAEHQSWADGDWYAVYIPSLHQWRKGVYHEVALHEGAIIESDLKVFLPRQDQLQEALAEPFETAGITFRFTAMLLNRFSEFWSVLTSDFMTMEALWLGFYMHEKHGKRWNDDTRNWVKA
jgi:hypothetical protein